MFMHIGTYGDAVVVAILAIITTLGGGGGPACCAGLEVRGHGCDEGGKTQDCRKKIGQLHGCGGEDWDISETYKKSSECG